MRYINKKIILYNNLMYYPTNDNYKAEIVPPPLNKIAIIQYDKVQIIDNNIVYLQPKRNNEYIYKPINPIIISVNKDNEKKCCNIL